MSNIKKRALWIAPDGRKFNIFFSNEEELYEKIAAIRSEHGYPQPSKENNTMMAAVNLTSEQILKAAIQSEDLPEEFRKQLEEQFNKVINKAESKGLN